MSRLRLCTATPWPRAAVASLLSITLAVGPTAANVEPTTPAVSDQTLADEVRNALDDDDSARAVTLYDRWLELHPNDPQARAALYMGMSAAATKAGRRDDARHASEIAQALDPSIGDRFASTTGSDVRVRGVKGRDVADALVIASSLIVAIQQARSARRQADLPPAPPPQAWPPAPAGYPGYQAPPQGYQPPPGWDPNAYPQPQQAQQQAAPPPGYQPPPQPYGMPQGWAPPPTTRGELTVIRVLHDHSVDPATAWSAPSCGALLRLEGDNLSFTPSGGEAPMLIPGDQIRSIKLNQVVGTELGAFRIETRKGLYLSLAPEQKSPMAGSAVVDRLRDELLD